MQPQIRSKNLIKPELKNLTKTEKDSESLYDGELNEKWNC